MSDNSTAAHCRVTRDLRILGRFTKAIESGLSAFVRRLLTDVSSRAASFVWKMTVHGTMKTSSTT